MIPEDEEERAYLEEIRKEADAWRKMKDEEERQQNYIGGRPMADFRWVEPRPSPSPDEPPQAVVIDFPDHPTLLEIAERQQFIDSRYARAHRVLMVVKTGTLASPLLSVCNLAMEIATHFVLFGLLFAFFAITTFSGAALWRSMKREIAIGPGITPLELVPFDEAENKALISSQEPEIFLSGCSCPGCGEVAVHPLRPRESTSPEWCSVIRTCNTCQREWAQK